MKPLFRDPGEGDEREDGFSQPHGFLLGPMGMIDRAEMADQYFRAANLLINRIDQQEVADYEVAYPVLFLYRHALELVMKCILGGGKTSPKERAMGVREFHQRPMCVSVSFGTN